MESIYFTAFITACVTSFASTPLSIWLAKRWNVMDMPSARKVHTEPIARWGGLAIFLGVIVSLIAVYLAFPRFQMLLDYRYSVYQDGKLAGIVSMDKQLAGILVGLTTVVILGMMDDRNSISAVVKLPIQIIAAMIALNYGVQIAGLKLPLIDDYVHFPILFSQIITVFWIIGFMNAINLADGLDGLAVGIAAIASGTFLAVAIIQGPSSNLFVAKQLKLAALLSAVLFGSCMGFLPYNFSPARVFMGDGGALGIGFLLGSITVIGMLKTTAVLSIIIPIIVIGLPILDVSLAMIRRYRSGRRIMEPDREHLHHRLLGKGWTTREVVLLVYVLTLLLSVIAMFLAIVKEGA